MSVDETDIFFKLVMAAAEDALERKLKDRDPRIDLERKTDRDRLKWAIDEFKSRIEKCSCAEDYAFAEAAFWIGAYAGDPAAALRKGGRNSKKPEPEWWSEARAIMSEMKSTSNRPTVINYVWGKITKMAEDGTWEWDVPGKKALRQALFPKERVRSTSTRENAQLTAEEINQWWFQHLKDIEDLKKEGV